ncbi:alpha/beta fold hydrolase [Paenibacillus humicola]|uniref:alpha/beta fold hydrolase n=1 Tax=Paenibacillus humicola TaxID=3110540 RepID=UPI00237A3103|nr:alpha/beta hydrolase [Paenibacillus humicola]
MNTMSLSNRKIRLTNGMETAFYDSGSKGGLLAPDEAIVLLHGFCGSSVYWERIAPMAESLGRVIAPDLRGHGGSSAPDEAVYRMDDFADDLGLLLQELEIGGAYLFGHSLGGYVSLAFAERYPEKLRALALVHSTAMPDSDEAKLGRDKAAETIRTGGIRPFVEGLVPKLFAPAHRESMGDQVRRMIEAGYETTQAGAAATALGMKERPDRRAVLEGLAVPRLLLAGAEDGLIPPEKVFTADGPGVTRALLESSGHMSMIEAPAELFEKLDAFVRQV